MSLILRSLNTTPICPICSHVLRYAIIQQIRWKSKKAESDSTLTVRLLKDIPKFGRKGSIMKVAAGRMRNIWFPYGMAEYINPREVKKISVSEIQTERDTTFQPDMEKSKEKQVGLALLTDREAITILERFLPESLQFVRSTIADSGDNSIHGSITASDVASTIRAMAVAQGGEAARLVITSENIKFGQDMGGDKIRRLGNFTFEIHLKETQEFVRRRVVVLKQQASAAAEKKPQPLDKPV